MAASKNARVRAKQREKRRERGRQHKLADLLGYDGVGGTRPAGLPKMSDVLVAFAQPILATIDDDAPLEEYRSALRFASVIWNLLALFDEERRRSGGVLVDQNRLAELTKLLEEAVGGFDDHSLAMIDELRERRRTLFAGDRRIVMNVDAELQGNRIHVLAASTML